METLKLINVLSMLVYIEIMQQFFLVRVPKIFTQKWVANTTAVYSNNNFHLMNCNLTHFNDSIWIFFFSMGFGYLFFREKNNNDFIALLTDFPVRFQSTRFTTGYHMLSIFAIEHLALKIQCTKILDKRCNYRNSEYGANYNLVR